MHQDYLQHTKLLMQAAPFVFEGGGFALKGGTAINLYIRDIPRLSVDLDLVFVDHLLPREEALRAVNERITSAAARLRQNRFMVQTPVTDGAGETKMIIRRRNIKVKVEINTVMRGTVNPVSVMSLAPKAREMLALSADGVPVASFEDIYAGKLIAALDRQHPRDLFDVMQLFANEGITRGVLRAFVIYLICGNRPFHEILFPGLRDINHDFHAAFTGMETGGPVEVETLLAVRERMVREIQEGLTDAERRFILTFAAADPDWEILDIPHAKDLPGVKWRLLNLRRLQTENPRKFEERTAALKRLQSM